MSIQTGPDQNFKYQDYNILIVDDTPINLEVVVKYLEEYGFGIRIARSGEMAIKRIRYDPPDLVLLDILMPGIDGFETCRRIKRLEAGKDLPIILMTSLSSLEDKVKGFEAGAVDYVTKPLQQEEVLARIKTHLRLRSQALSLQEQHRLLERSSQVERDRLFQAIGQQRQQMQALNQKLTEVQEAERKQLARELHDELGQALTAISINLSAAIQDLLPERCPSLYERLNESRQLADQTLEQVRELSFNLRPAMLDDLGLVPALRWYSKRYTQRANIQVDIETSGLTERLPSHIETALYRIFQEALTNVARHAQASSVRIWLQGKELSVNMQIEDNGQGFDIVEILSDPTTRHGTGLLSMRERTILLGGAFHIHSKPGQGTRVSIDIPIGE